jgi:transketolase
LGETEELLSLGDIENKWRSFGWEAFTVDGHSFNELIPAFEKINQVVGKPSVIIANTIKGKGISFMEGKPEWHNKMPDLEQLAQARSELGLH